MKKIIALLIILFFTFPCSAGLLLETDIITDKNITSLIEVGSYTSSDRGRLVYAHVQLTSLTSTAADISASLIDGSKSSTSYYLLSAESKILAEKTIFDATLGPFYVLSGGTVSLQVLSSNAGDTAVDGHVYWLDAQAVDISLWGGTDVSSKLSGDNYIQVDVQTWDGNDVHLSDSCYPQVDVFSIGNETPLSDTNIVDAMKEEFGDGPYTSSVSKEDIRAEMDDNSTKLAGIDVNLAATPNAIFSKTGITAGGTWTFEDIIKIQTAWLVGEWQDKSGSPGTYQILDAEDQNTVVIEVDVNNTSKYKEITIP